MKQKAIIIVVVLLVVIVAVMAVKRKKAELASLPTPQVAEKSVQVARVATGPLESTVHYLGFIEPYSKADLSARISGSILDINKREGEKVSSGELLVSIDDRELTQRATAAQAELLSAREKLAGAKSAYETQKSIYDRDVILVKAGAISEEALERSRAAADGARSTVDALGESIKGLEMNYAAVQIQVSYAKLYAPFDGVVSKRWSDPGDMALPGKPILTVEKTSSYKVLAQVPQEDAQKIKAGDRVYLSNGEQIMTTEVHQVYPALGSNMLATVEVLTEALPFGLPSGSTVGFDVVVKKLTGVIVPENSLVQAGQESFIYLVQNNVIHIQKVQVLDTGNGKAVIKGSVEAGDWVAVGQENKLLTLSEGSSVRVAEEKK